MKILLGHNYYQNSGGEDLVYRDEVSLLRSNGFEVLEFTRNNDYFESLSIPGKIKALFNLGWSNKSYSDIKKSIRAFKPDIAHFHNIFYHLTPSVYSACKEEGVPVVQTLHNFRIFCSNGLMLRRGLNCEICLELPSFKAVFHRCYRSSAFLTYLIYQMLIKHNKKKTWHEQISTFIALSEFSREKFVRFGIKEEKIMVRPNFVFPTDVDVPLPKKKGGYALYMGRMSGEKGVEKLIEAWREIKGIPLYLAGNGPEEEFYFRLVKEKNISNVKFLGYIDGSEKINLLREARFIVVPSLCYENSPRIISEAFSMAVPVIANKTGSLIEIISDGKTGLLFDIRINGDLKEKAEALWDNDTLINKMSQNAFNEYRIKYSPQASFNMLCDIYKRTLEARHNA
ncbi:MAG: glycosyltransferase family 4 protein [Candidatus Omnitrophica bacterium]|nr:glycosyltransferase family 4 protein [Candidatus Omnitrophota bacterium]